MTYGEVAGYIDAVERIFRVEAGPYQGIDFAVPPESDEFIARYAKWPNFTRRNVAVVLNDGIKGRNGPEVWLNATVTGFKLDHDNGRLVTVTATAPSGTTAILAARRFVLCAGAIESTRLLLWLHASQSNAPAPGSPALGRWFHDHLSAPLAEIQTASPRGLNRLAAFMFRGATMRNLRYELSPLAQRRFRLTSGFCHFAFMPLYRSGFDDLRDFMLSLQRRRPDLAAFGRAALDARFLAMLAWWRMAYRQLYWPVPSRLELHVVVEQLPQARNRITLSERRDRYGVPLAKLDWKVSDQDATMLRGFAERFAAFWEGSHLAELGTLAWTPPLAAINANNMANLNDIYHPCGSTRMGSDPTESVVDRDLSVWTVPNLSLVATSVFPNVAGANPTMTLLLFALRHADHLKSILSK